jgi:hypothetical protein
MYFRYYNCRIQNVLKYGLNPNAVKGIVLKWKFVSVGYQHRVVRRKHISAYQFNRSIRVKNF